jgi:PAS domain-containing protein
MWGALTVKLGLNTRVGPVRVSAEYRMPLVPTLRARICRDLLERTASAGVWWLDLETDELTWSDQLAVLHGAEPGYCPSRRQAFDFYAPEWRDAVEKLIAACAAEGTAFDREVQIITLQQRRAWCRVVGKAVMDEAGVVVAVAGVLQEIAPPVHAPGTLLHHTLTMGGAIGSGEGFVTVDREGRYSYVNQEAEGLLHSRGGALIGRKIWNSFQMTARLRLEEQFRNALSKGMALELEELDARLGTWLELRGYAFGGGLAVHLRDVSARRRVQEQLRLLESSIARLNDVVIITEAAPFRPPGPRIVFVNDAF